MNQNASFSCRFVLLKEILSLEPSMDGRFEVNSQGILLVRKARYNCPDILVRHESEAEKKTIGTETEVSRLWHWFAKKGKQAITL